MNPGTGVKTASGNSSSGGISLARRWWKATFSPSKIHDRTLPGYLELSSLGGSCRMILFTRSKWRS